MAPLAPTEMLKTEDIVVDGMVPIPVSQLDFRSDAEIIAKLNTYQPITSEKNVWGFWDKGFEHMPAWTKRNVINWVRRLGPTWTVRVVNLATGSNNNVFQYIPMSARKEFPPAFNNRKMSGKGAGQHAGDLVRLVVLYHFGGVYMDVGTMLFRTLDDICWSAIEDSRTPYKVAGFALQFRRYFGQMMNNFIACQKHNPFIRRWHEIYVKMWGNSTDVTNIHRHPLVRHLGLLRPDDPTFGENPDYEAFTDYASHFLAYERLRLLREPGEKGFDGASYFKEHFFLLDAWPEMYRDQDVIDGETMFELLNTVRDTSSNASNRDLQQEAERFVHNLLVHSSVAKFSQGFWQPGMPLAVTSFWKRAGNEEADSRPGTWGEYLRYVATHFEQTRDYRQCLVPLVIPEEMDEIVEVGYLEAL
ncbi:putative capsule polysaccharide biosynthesis protein [Sclerotinia borealis F-4128]|uniref:Putative capsule polysaccharide biosynthesis protein n=1 Tax=Sclerotinia borealis (strain F-4128) TaxID=1432307 RepID=W9CI99_SCLBF|nr:putative capsule polysaccharide biosynthesis protein [Sclerotinia borealis F-4128]